MTKMKRVTIFFYKQKSGKILLLPLSICINQYPKFHEHKTQKSYNKYV